MPIYVGNCADVIEWGAVIASLEDQVAAYIGPRHDVGHPVPGVNEVVAPLRTAGYKMKNEGGNASWDMFLAGINFDVAVVEKFCDWAGMEGYTNAWISRVKPGDVAPWHWDITDDETTLSKESKGMERYHVHIGRPEPGHVLMVEDKVFYLEAEGNTYKWPSRKSWHAGANAGLVPKYLFNIWR
ncbi:MAG: hypothetical protein EBX50_09595 [Chitinophagia bacterium]|nr:hypothetical protein [Chitinophagia bacterium]